MMEAKTEQKQGPKLETVVLNQAHTHKRKPCKKDDEIQVLPHVADYLEKRKIGKRK